MRYSTPTPPAQSTRFHRVTRRFIVCPPHHELSFESTRRTDVMHRLDRGGSSDHLIQNWHSGTFPDHPRPRRGADPPRHEPSETPCNSTRWSVPSSNVTFRRSSPGGLLRVPKPRYQPGRPPRPEVPDGDSDATCERVVPPLPWSTFAPPFEPGTPIGADERLIQVPRGISSATVSQRPAALSSSQWCSSHARAGPWADRKVRAGKSATSGTLSPLGPSTSPSALLWTEGGARLDRACERNGVLS